MLELEDTVLVIVDVQEKLFPAMYEKETLRDNLNRLIRGAGVLGVPALVTEQNPAGLGPTVVELSTLLQEVPRLSKFSFSCLGEPSFRKALEAAGRRQVLLCGIEAHVCVYQTACDLVTAGYPVSVVADAVSSRTRSNRMLGLHAMHRKGAYLTSVEMALFELLKVARGPLFKEIIKIVK
jgi:nicotinamidase-related amidase